MSDKPQNVQEVFLAHLRDRQTPVTIFLMNGIKQQGVIDTFDRFSVLLRRDHHSTLLYKSTITTIVPLTVVRLFDEERSPPQAKTTLSLRS